MKKVIVVFVIALAALAAGAAWSNAQGVQRDVDGTPLPPNVHYRAFVHYPKGGEEARGRQPATLPSCTPTANDQIQDYGLTPWHLTVRTYQLNGNTVPRPLSAAQVESALNSGWAAWKGADSHIAVTEGPSTAASKPKYDGVNLVAWGNIPNNAIAVTYTWYNGSTGAQLESDTIFGNRLKWSYTAYAGDDCGGVLGTYDVQNIATHEFGHWVGLDDLYDSVDKDLTMYGYGFLRELKEDTLGAGDIAGAVAIMH